MSEKAYVLTYKLFKNIHYIIAIIKNKNLF